MTKFTIADLPARYQDQIAAQLNRGKPLGMARASAVGQVEIECAPKKRIRQSTKPVLNALETRFHSYFVRTYPDRTILSQAVRIELARGIWFKPDFYCPTIIGRPTFFETKGKKAFRGGFENLKVAARVHSWASFFLVWEDEKGAWQHQEILP